MNFSTATQIQPRNGQQLNDVTGLTINARAWSKKDFKQFPQATRQLGVDQCLVVSKDDNLVYAVPVQEASDNGVVAETIEIEEGVLGWAALL